MTADYARRQIVLYSLITSMVYTAFLILSPLIIQVSAADAFRVAQIIFPVFAGYLGSSVLFLFQPREPDRNIADPMILKYLIYGPFSIFWALGICIFAFYYMSNLEGGIPGMDVDELSNYVTMLVSFMNITVGMITAYLFNSKAAPGEMSRDDQSIASPRGADIGR